MCEFLKSKIYKLLKDLGVPGAIISLKSERYPSFEIIYGYSDLEQCHKMSIKDRFRASSVTKTFTGIVFLQLYQEGLINLDDPVSKYILGIPEGNNITIREVGLMKSGIFNYVEDPLVIDTITNKPRRNWLTDELYGITVTHPLYFPPGTGFHYSNGNTLILGLIIERITRNSLENEINKRIIRPLCLTDTEFDTNSYLRKPRMEGYAIEDGEFENTTALNVSWAWAGGAISSSVRDMHVYAEYAIGKNVFLNASTAKQQREWTEPEILDTPCGQITRSYGFQLMKISTFIGHDGEIPGYNTVVLSEIKTKTTLIIAVNLEFTVDNELPANTIAYCIINYLHKYC